MSSKDELFTIESIINEYGSYIYNLSLKLSADPHKAEDLAQETFIKAWKNINQLNNRESLKSWLRTICVNEFRMMLRAEKRAAITYVENIEELEHDSILLVSIPPSAIDEIETTEEVAKLRDGCFLAMTRKLTLNQRIAFSLIDMFGLSINETAGILNLTPKATKGLLYRARMNLESIFDGHCSFVDINNPCSCTAWIEFMKDRDSFQKKMQEKTEYLDYKMKGYIFNAEVSQKIQYYYHHMPEQRPSQKWFDQVILLVKEFYK